MKLARKAASLITVIALAFSLASCASSAAPKGEFAEVAGNYSASIDWSSKTLQYMLGSYEVDNVDYQGNVLIPVKLELREDGSYTMTTDYTTVVEQELEFIDTNAGAALKSMYGCKSDTEIQEFAVANGWESYDDMRNELIENADRKVSMESKSMASVNTVTGTYKVDGSSIILTEGNNGKSTTASITGNCLTMTTALGGTMFFVKGT